jgi:hypothetical protein
MKFVPRNSQLIGRMTIKKSESRIIRTDETKVTKYILVDAVGPDAAAKGIKVGDLVLVISIRHIVQDAGLVFIPFADEKDVVLFVTDVTREELLVQTLGGKEFVPFDAPEAAPSFGASPKSSNGNTNAVAGAPV